MRTRSSGRPVRAGSACADCKEIAPHTSARIAERRNALCDLTRVGISIDFGWNGEFVTAADGDAIHCAYPRHSMAASLVDAIVGQARTRPEKAPHHSIASELVRERGLTNAATTLECQASAARWGD